MTLWRNCLYITLFFNIDAGNVQTFIKSWNQLLYPRVTQVCRLPFEPRYDFFLHLIIVVELSGVWWKSYVSSPVIMDSRYLSLPLSSAWKTSARNPSVLFVWRKAPRIWRDFGSVLPFQTRLTQIKPLLPLWNDHGSLVNDQGRRQCFHNKHKKFSYRPTRDASLLSGHASYLETEGPYLWK